MIDQLFSLSRINKQLIMPLADPVLLVLILLASFSIRMGHWHHAVIHYFGFKSQCEIYDMLFKDKR